MAHIVIDQELQDFLAQNDGVLTIGRTTIHKDTHWDVAVTVQSTTRREASITLGLALAIVTDAVLANAVPPAVDPVDVPDNPTDRERIEAVADEHGWGERARPMPERASGGTMGAVERTQLERDGYTLTIDWVKGGRVGRAWLAGSARIRAVGNEADSPAARRDVVLGVLAQTEHDPMARALAATPPLVEPEPAAAEPKSRAEQLIEAANALTDIAVNTATRVTAGLEAAVPDSTIGQLVNTVTAAAEAATALLRAADEHAIVRAEIEHIDPAVVVQLRLQLDQIREAASMAHAAQTPGTAAYALAEDILTIARCGA